MNNFQMIFICVYTDPLQPIFLCKFMKMVHKKNIQRIHLNGEHLPIAVFYLLAVEFTCVNIPQEMKYSSIHNSIWQSIFLVKEDA